MVVIKCPNCGKMTRGERFCQYCGEPFNVTDVRSSSPSLCTCGAEASPDAKYCPMCGGTLQQVSVDWKSISGEGISTVIPDSVKGWNWGAFFLTWIWGIGNRTYIAFLSFIPILNLAWPFVLGAKGSEWAWKNKKWNSVDHFAKIQRRWAISGFIVALIMLAFSTVLYDST